MSVVLNDLLLFSCLTALVLSRSWLELKVA
jgi:hypothetical protein